MFCPKCLKAPTKVFNTRAGKKTNQIWRRRRCDACGFSFSTREYIEADNLLVVVNGKEHLPFSRARLLVSLARACQHMTAHADIAYQLAATIENQLLQKSKDGRVRRRDITALALKALQRFDTKAYVTYLANASDIQDSRDLKNLLREK